MTDYDKGIVLEARKKRLTQSRDKNGDWMDVTFQIHPNDTSSALMNMPLGTRVYLVVTEIADEGAGDKTEQPAGTEGWSEAKRKMVQRSGIVRKEPAFHRFLEWFQPAVWRHIRTHAHGSEQAAAACIHQWCKVSSCRDLEPDAFTGDRFLELMVAYRAFQNNEINAAQQTQLESGPA